MKIIKLNSVKERLVKEESTEKEGFTEKMTTLRNENFENEKMNSTEYKTEECITDSAANSESQVKVINDSISDSNVQAFDNDNKVCFFFYFLLTIFLHCIF